LRRLRPT